MNIIFDLYTHRNLSVDMSQDLLWPLHQFGDDDMKNSNCIRKTTVEDRFKIHVSSILYKLKIFTAYVLHECLYLDQQ